MTDTPRRSAHGPARTGLTLALCLACLAGALATWQRQFVARSRCGRYLLFPGAGHAELVTDERQVQQVSRVIIQLVLQLRADGQGPAGGGH